MDKLTLISGTLFLAADIFALTSLVLPDWIVTEVGHHPHFSNYILLFLLIVMLSSPGGRGHAAGADSQLCYTAPEPGHAPLPPRLPALGVGRGAGLHRPRHPRPHR